MTRCDVCGRTLDWDDACDQKWMQVAVLGKAGGPTRHACSYACLGALAIAEPELQQEETA